MGRMWDNKALRGLQTKRYLAAIVMIAVMFVSFRFQENQAVDLLNKMIARNAEIQTLEYNMTGKERIKDKIIEKTTYFKININPYKVYFRQKIIGIDVEGFYGTLTRNNKIAIKTKGFPWISANFDPMDNMMRNNHHHTIHEAGFNYMVGLVKYLMLKHKEDLNKKISVKGIEKVNNRDCYKIVMNIDEFHYMKYKIQKGETLPVIAKKYMISDYMIMEKNKEIGGYDDVKEGQQILIPSDYAKQIVFLLDKDLLVPARIELYDDLGLYAEYSFYNIVTNPIVTDKEFKKRQPKRQK